MCGCKVVRRLVRVEPACRYLAIEQRVIRASPGGAYYVILTHVPHSNGARTVQ